MTAAFLLTGQRLTQGRFQDRAASAVEGFTMMLCLVKGFLENRGDLKLFAIHSFFYQTLFGMTML